MSFYFLDTIVHITPDCQWVPYNPKHSGSFLCTTKWLSAAIHLLMGRKQWEAWSVFNDAEIKWAHLQYSQRKKKKKGLIHKHRYDSARLCVLVSGKQRDPQVLDLVVDLWCYGPFFNGDAPGLGLRGSGRGGLHPQWRSRCHPGALRLCLPKFGGCYGSCDSVFY